MKTIARMNQQQMYQVTKFLDDNKETVEKLSTTFKVCSLVKKELGISLSEDQTKSRLSAAGIGLAKNKSKGSNSNGNGSKAYERSRKDIRTVARALVFLMDELGVRAADLSGNKKSNIDALLKVAESCDGALKGEK